MVNFAVVGIGRMGGLHAKNLAKKNVKNARLVAICDIDNEKIEKFQGKFGNIKAYSSHKDLLQDKNVDVVIVAVPHYGHVDIAIDCLRAGKHLLVEKPIAVQVSEGERLLAEYAKHKELVFSMMYNQRTNRMYKRAKEIIERGELGEIRRVDFIITNWYRSSSYYNQGGWRASWSGEGGGALINQCIHQLDILQWLVGMPNKITAKCNTRNRDITVENEVIAIFEYPNNMTCSFTARTNELIGVNRLEIAGDKGRIVISTASMKYYKFARSEQEVNATTKNGLYGFVRYKKKKYIYGFRNAINDVTKGQQINIIRNLTNVIEGKAELIAPATEGTKALELINSIYLSNQLNKPVDLPIDNMVYNKILEGLIAEELSHKNKSNS